MKLFVQYDQAGNILSVMKMESLPEGVNQPYGAGALGEGEQVLEVPATDELLELETIQLLNTFRVDLEKKKLVKKSN